MAKTVGELQALLRLDKSHYDRGINDAESRLGRLAAGIGRWARRAGLVLGTAVVAGVGVAGRAVVEFDSGMREVFTLLPGISDVARQEMEDDVLSFARTAGVIPSEVIPALYQAISAGVPADNVFDFMKVASEAAIGGVTTLETAVDGISSVVNAYGSEVITAGQVADQMFDAVKRGKCVVGSTRVLLADGSYRRIDELEDGGTVVSFDGRNFTPMPATWVDQGTKPTVTVRTRLGREITTTWNHPYLTEQGWRKVSELDLGDAIAVPTSLPYFGDKAVPEAEAALIGLWLAEGSTRSSSPRITTNRYGEEVAAWAKAFGCDTKQIERREGRAAVYEITANRRGGRSTNPFLDRLRSLGLADLTSAEKRIPDEVFTWDRRSVAALLHWMFNGDGWLTDARPAGRSGFQAGFCSKSERLVRDVSHLLLRFGIVGRLRDRGNAWVWETNRYAEIARFVDLIGIDRPAAALVPDHQPVTQRAMWGVVEYDPIVAITEGPDERVYDLVVPDLHNFVAEDIVAHNTTFDELSESLFQVIPTASALGVGFGDITAALAQMTAQGTPTRVATTQLRQLLVELSKAGTKSAEAFEELSGRSFAEFIDEGGNVADALDIMIQAAEDSGVALADMFGSVEAANAALALAADGTDAYRAGILEANSATGAATAAFEEMDAGAGRSMERIKANIAAMMITFGEKLLPVIETVVQWVVDNWPQIEATIATVWEEISALVSWLWDEVLSPLIETVLKPVVEWVKENWAEISSTMATVFEGAKTAVGILIRALRRLWDDWLVPIFDWIKANWPEIKSAAEDVWNGVAAVLEPVIAFLEDVWNALGALHLRIPIMVAIGVALAAMALTAMGPLGILLATLGSIVAAIGAIYAAFNDGGVLTPLQRLALYGSETGGPRNRDPVGGRPAVTTTPPDGTATQRRHSGGVVNAVPRGQETLVVARAGETIGMGGSERPIELHVTVEGRVELDGRDVGELMMAHGVDRLLVRSGSR